MWVVFVSRPRRKGRKLQSTRWHYAGRGDNRSGQHVVGLQHKQGYVLISSLSIITRSDGLKNRTWSSLCLIMSRSFSQLELWYRLNTQRRCTRGIAHSATSVEAMRSSMASYSASSNAIRIRTKMRTVHAYLAAIRIEFVCS